MKNFIRFIIGLVWLGVVFGLFLIILNRLSFLLFNLKKEDYTKMAKLFDKNFEFKTKIFGLLPGNFLNLAENEKARVTRVIDGDTIEIDTGKKIRYIGVDTPEMKSKSNSDCFADEAKNENSRLVLGKLVNLEKDISETDKFGRLLRYVYIDGVMVNEELLKNGYANIATFPPDVKYVSLFKNVQKYARDNNLGLWKSCPVK